MTEPPLQCTLRRGCATTQIHVTYLRGLVGERNLHSGTFRLALVEGAEVLPLTKGEEGAQATGNRKQDSGDTAGACPVIAPKPCEHR